MAEQPSRQPAAADEQAPGAKKARGWHFWPVVGLGVIVGIFVVGLVGALVVALLADPGDAANWVGMIRDLFIIVLAMEGMLMGVALIVLILQLAALVNVLQNEIKPIVDRANETVTTVRGTSQFISQNVVEPVIKFGAITAALGGIAREVFGIRRALHSADGKSEIEKPKE